VAVAVEITTMVPFPDGRVEPEEGLFLSLLTLFPIAEPSAQTVAVVPPRQIEEERAEVAQAGVF
jgi:hypothetical protein